ncbi:single-stranded DNA-binding protein [Iocasia frigidifontis]|uniref:Single-stranded DNA-binding protein n=1 Tax=Iocasia fonsfrigidae TaxID=2682810 RepID=A0A8A7KEX8_9FIRM|nr:single-stranded DNA-binding protein [Iocasia fonsfrigidae]QTL99820.1 single-stranded DNA-binding protein [Iocasia fonsfrigidae]
MLNHIVLIGRLVRDPELRYISNGTAVSNFTLAVERNYTNQQGERDVDFIRIVTWRKLAETCAHHLGKGRLVAVEGSLQISSSEKDGRTYTNPQVIANEVRFLDWPNDNNRDNRSTNNTNATNNNNNDSGNDTTDNFDIDDNFDVPF